MIHEEDFFRIGYVSRLHGIKGEVEAHMEGEAFDEGDAEYVMLKLDGLLVPFFWSEYRFKGQSGVIFKFDDVDTEAEARTLIGAEVFYPREAMSKEAPGLLSWNLLTGYLVTDAEGATVGRVKSVDNRSCNVLLIAEREDGSELFLPFHEDLVAELNHEERRIALHIADGLLSLNA